MRELIQVDLVAVDLRPAAARTTPNESLEEIGFVERKALPVDPSPGERDGQDRWVPDGLDVRLHLGDPQPDAVGLLVILGQPHVPFLR